ncbi:unnamed protein product [Phyllotreta striolata]|uniref:Transmembrane protein 186 n=1 Tax=Phyllotreta striolata TaxID=444603 RepID=A0A9N9TKN9_PHYSR|nr:unnamed protein product [Phyllotreta striolata]
MYNLLTKLYPKAIRLGINLPKYALYRNVHTTSATFQFYQDETKYKTIYKFPYIKQFVLMDRIKLYQTSVTALCAPFSIILHQLDYISGDVVGFIWALGFSMCLTLYSVGFLTTKHVGFIYYNEEENLVKVAYGDFWGRRKEIEIPVKDIVPLSDLPVSWTDGLFIKFKRFSTPEVLRLNFRFGVVVDKELMKKIQ